MVTRLIYHAGKYSCPYEDRFSCALIHYVYQLEVCYYDEHNIDLNFGFGFGVGLDRDLMKVYNEFALAHADYRVFQDDKGEVFLYDD